MVATSFSTGRPQTNAAAPRQILLENELQAVALEEATLAQGPSAGIYQLPETPALVAKVFYRPPQDLADRLAAMFAKPPLDPQTGQRHPAIAWPVERVLASGAYRACIGYTMPHVLRAHTLAELFDPAAEPAQGPHYGQRIRACRRLAGAVRALHACGHVVGGWDPAHVLIDDQGNLTLVSADSFQIAGDEHVFPCRGTAVGIRSAEQDLVCLAGIVRRLLQAGASSAGKPNAAPLPQTVKALLELSSAQGQPGARPDAAAWENALAEVETRLQACPVSSRHYYPLELGECPWCEQARATGQDPYPMPAPASRITELAPVGRTACAGGPQAKESAPMEPQDDNFDLFVDSLPPGTLKAPTNTPAPLAQPPVDNQVGYGSPAPPAPAAPPGYTPQPQAPVATPPVYAPPAPAAAPAAPPVFMPSVPVTPPAALPVFGSAAQPTPTPPKRSHLGAIVAVVLVLVAINALVVAHLNGLLSFPDLTSSGSRQNAQKPAIAKARKTNEPTAPDAKGPVVPGGNAAEVVKNAGPAQPKGQQPPEPKVQPQVQPKVQPPVQPQPQQPQPAAKPRSFKSTRDVLAAVQSHLLKVPEDERKFQRYLTLVHLYNDKGISDKQLDEYRTALTTLVRYLRPTKEVRIEPIDPARVVLCLDLRTAGWDAPGIWLDVLKQYPYGLVYSEAKDLEIADLGKDISELSGSDVPIVRLDWFLFAAGRGSLSTRLGPPEENSLLPPAITALNKRYVQDVTLEQAARELGLANANPLREAVQSSELLRNRGLAPFQMGGGVVSRTVWSSLTRGTSACQEAGLQLGLGSVYSDIR